MIVDSTRIFQTAWYENLVSSVLGATSVWLYFLLQSSFTIPIIEEWLLFGMPCIFGIALMVFLYNVFIRQKIIVTSHALIITNAFGRQLILFESIKMIKTDSGIFVVTVQSNQKIRLRDDGMSTKKLNEIKEFVLQKIRIHHPEHFKLVNLPRYEVENFWRE